MNPTIALITLLAVLLLLSFGYLAARRGKRLPDPDEALAVIRSLDIEAFRNLVQPEEEAFLRARLPVPEFRRIKRERSRAALTYVAALSEVSLQFVRLGDAAQRSAVPAIAASGKQLANSAVYLRLRTMDARVRLTLAAAFPDLATDPLSPLLEHYDRVTSLLQNHLGLQHAGGVAV